jgi:hypothetical protein
MPKPELGPVAVGDRLLVIPATYNNRIKREPVLAKATKVARVWVDLEEVTGATQPRTWRLRLDTQNDGGEGGYRDRFVTPDQYAWERQITEATAVLRAAKAHPDFGSPWAKGDRLLALADFIRQYDEQPA